ncbi:MAG: OsmC family protein [Planctomycetes bacterium]|nr:OsmC family protein [Planctomycetota bacterium]
MKAHATIGPSGFRTGIRVGEDLEHMLVSDEPIEQNGNNEGPTAMGLLAAALGACTAATLRSYANLKGIELEGVDVEVEAVRRKPSEQAAAGEGAKGTLIRKKITIRGDKITPEQRERMLQIAEKCPVNRTLLEGADIEKL